MAYQHKERERSVHSRSTGAYAYGQQSADDWQENTSYPDYSQQQLISKLTAEVKQLQADLATFEPYRLYLSQLQSIAQLQIQLETRQQQLTIQQGQQRQQEARQQQAQSRLDAQHAQQRQQEARQQQEQSRLDAQHAQQQQQEARQQQEQSRLDTQHAQQQQQATELHQKYQELMARRKQLSRLESIVLALRQLKHAYLIRATHLPPATIDLPIISFSHPTPPSGLQSPIMLEAQNLQHRLSDPTYRDDALASVRQLYYERSQTLVHQAHVAGALIQPEHVVLLRELLTSTDQQNLLGARLRLAGKVEHLLKIAAESDPIWRMQQLIELASSLIRVSQPIDPSPFERDYHPFIEAVRRLDSNGIARALASNNNQNLIRAAVRADKLVRLPLRRLLRSHDARVVEFAQQALTGIAASSYNSHNQPFGDADRRVPTEPQVTPEPPRDTTALKQILQRAGTLPAVMGRSFAQVSHMPLLVLELIAEEISP